MQRFEWSPALETGNKFIDSDHRFLIERVNTVLEAITKGRSSELLEGALFDLVAYTREHFAREEEEMLRIGYAQTQEHVAEHAKLLKTVNALKTEFESGEKIDPLTLFNLLSHWLRHHILQVDMKLALALKRT